MGAKAAQWPCGHFRRSPAVLAQGGDPLEPHGTSRGSLQRVTHSVEHWLFGPRVSSRPLVRPPGGMERGVARGPLAEHAVGS